MDRRTKAIEDFQTDHRELVEALNAGGHELEFFVIYAGPGQETAKVGCNVCRQEWLGRRAENRGRGLSRDAPCPGPLPDRSLVGRLRRRFGKLEE